MCGDAADLPENIRILEAFGVDLLHIDFMDGHFVDNLVIGTDLIQALRAMTHIPLDIHLMHESAEEALEMIDIRETDQVLFHLQSTRHPWRLADKIRGRGAKAGLVIPTDTPLARVTDLLPAFDIVQIMSVPTGVAGAPFFAGALEKTRQLRRTLDQTQPDRPIQMDGSITHENMTAVLESGANVLILGYAACFNRSMGLVNALAKTRSIIAEFEHMNAHIISNP
jgi:ribulose-phosphate 3-epimerase